MKTDAGVGRQEGTLMMMFAGSLSGRATRAGSRWMSWLGRAALRMITAALEAEVDQYVASLVDEHDEDGKRLVVRNGRRRSAS
jgi:hypothetical protein